MGRDGVYQIKDKNGNTFIDELNLIGYKGDTLSEAFPFHAYFEYHIEQGPILDREGITIGVPKGIVSLNWFDIQVNGKANQAGPTPMEERHDALVASAEMVLAANRLAKETVKDIVVTVGEMNVYPNSRNTIPGRVDFTLDIRSWDEKQANNAWINLQEEMKNIAGKHGCSIKINETWRVPNNPFDKHLMKRIRDIAHFLNYSTLDMVSGAGHDASYMAMVGPTAMIFVPSIEGHSHVEEENTHWNDCTLGANVLLLSVLITANEI